jgi:hypothetical protein
MSASSMADTLSEVTRSIDDAVDDESERDGYSPNGFRFFVIAQPDEEADEDTAPYELGDASMPEAQVFGRSEVVPEARRVKDALSAKLGRPEARWATLPSPGGAGDDWTAYLSLGVASVTFLIGAPKLWSDSWKVLRRWMAALRANRRGDSWEAGSEVGVLLCLLDVRKQVRQPQIIASEVRVVEDGRIPPWMQAARLMHIVVIPELSTQTTFVYAVDAEPKILGRMSIPRLTSDALDGIERRLHRQRRGSRRKTARRRDRNA